MKLKLTIIPIIIIIIAIGTYFATNFLLETNCLDGAGSEYYVNAVVAANYFSSITNDLNRGFLDNTKYAKFIQMHEDKAYLAKHTWNCAGTKHTYEVDQSTFDGSKGVIVSKDEMQYFLNQYSMSCKDCVIKMYSAGNSPIFVEECP